jgi:hypothetical protein
MMDFVSRSAILKKQKPSVMKRICHVIVAICDRALFLVAGIAIGIVLMVVLNIR